jgi:hypothetical protein
MLETTLVEYLLGNPLKCKRLPLATNIRQGWKSLPRKNVVSSFWLFLGGKEKKV